MTHTVHLFGANHQLTTQTALSQMAHDPWERPDLPVGSSINLLAVTSEDWSEQGLFTDGGITLASEASLTYSDKFYGDTWVMYEPLDGPCMHEVVHANLREFNEGQARVIIQAARQAVLTMADRHQGYTKRVNEAALQRDRELRSRDEAARLDVERNEL